MSAETVYAEDNLNNIKEMLEYWQDQIYSIDKDIQDANLNRDDSELTPQELADKREAFEAKRELEANRREAIREYSQAKTQEGGLDSGQASLKRSANSYLEGPSKK